jgi:methionine aminotransferase
MFTPKSKLPQVSTTIFTVITQRARELGAINLSQGFPDYDPPEQLRALLAQAAGEGMHQYAPMTGVDALREQIVLAAQAHGIEADAAEEVTVTLGASESVFSSIQALVQTDDEVIVFDPAFDIYGPAIALCGARSVNIPLQPPSFAIDWQRVRDAISPRTRMIIINSPHNPTGAVLSQQDMDTLAELVRDTPIIVLSDEVYANMLYDNRRHHSAQAHPELRERSISVFSFGKMLHATGWRVGYAIAPPSITRELRKVHQFNTFSIAYPLQWAIAEFLKSCPEHRAGLAAFYQEKRDLFLTLLQNSRFTWTPSPGSFFQLLEYSKISSECDTEFAEHVLREHGVASIPLSPFCAQPVDYRYLRFCFAKRDETLAKAAELLCKI